MVLNQYTYIMYNRLILEVMYILRSSHFMLKKYCYAIYICVTSKYNSVLIKHLNN